MVISRRLQAAAMLVTEGSRLADIGTDHAFVPIWLVEEGRIPCAVAMDVNTGPLDRAMAHIRERGLSDRIRTRLSDGLDALAEDEADTVLIAGMGGALTVRILERRPALCQEIRELVLQPQSEIASVRRYLERSGWRIDKECIVCEDGKYYPMMRCTPGGMQLSDTQAEYGPCLMQERPSAWMDYLRWRMGILEENLCQLQKAEGTRGVQRREEVQAQIRLVRKLLDG